MIHCLYSTRNGLKNHSSVHYLRKQDSHELEGLGRGRRERTERYELAEQPNRKGQNLELWLGGVAPDGCLSIVTGWSCLLIAIHSTTLRDSAVSHPDRTGHHEAIIVWCAGASLTSEPRNSKKKQN